MDGIRPRRRWRRRGETSFCSKPFSGGSSSRGDESKSGNREAVYSSNRVKAMLMDDRTRKDWRWRARNACDDTSWVDMQVESNLHSYHFRTSTVSLSASFVASANVPGRDVTGASGSSGSPTEAHVYVYCRSRRHKQEPCIVAKSAEARSV